MTQDDTDDRKVFFWRWSRRGTPVKDSRALIADRFELTGSEVLAIERAGISAKWPPLNTDRQ